MHEFRAALPRGCLTSGTTSLDSILLIRRYNSNLTQCRFKFGAERIFGFSLMVPAVCCILQYVLLPFVLLLLGIASEGEQIVTILLG